MQIFIGDNNMEILSKSRFVAENIFILRSFSGMIPYGYENKVYSYLHSVF